MNIDHLPVKTVQSIHDVMLNACLAFELGADPKPIINRAKHSAIGAQHKAYTMLIEADMDRISRIILERL